MTHRARAPEGRAGLLPHEAPAPEGRAGARRSLGPLDPVDRLPGLGAAAKHALAEHGIRMVVDLLWTAPSGWDDLRAPRALAEVVADAREAPVRATFAAIVDSASMVPIGRRRGVRVVLRDATDAKCKLHAFWFFAAHGILGFAEPGLPVLVTGKVAVVPGKPPRTAHPDLVADTPETRSVRARYPRLGPNGALLRRAIAHAVAELTTGEGTLVDPVPGSIARREGLPDAARVLRRIHAAEGLMPVPDERDRRAFVERLAWAEGFARAWERLVAEESVGTDPAIALPPAPEALARLEEALGFELTTEQRQACAEIGRDLAGPRPMRRLLLGDVGTGKTAVALVAVAQCALAGRQAAILAPTSVLAEQYVAAVRPLERATGARVAFLAADLAPAAQREALAAAASGAASVVIGTHSLLAEGVAIPRLSLVVVDEQQRLGVGQRLALVKKGTRPHLLTLTATPIPRTLALALRGELATSTLRTRPRGRRPVMTTLVPRDELAAVVAQARAATRRGERVFWVVPRVEAPDEDEDEDASVDARAKALRRTLGKVAVGMIHGRMTGAEKREAMQAFREGRTPVLVGTTVVEVGVDVPEATLIVVEEAERYGLAQLHQLRGRVGRGAREGTCILLHGPGLDGLARRRLEALTRLETGEDVARADLELRGAGDLGGTRQHGEEDELVYLEPNAGYPWLERLDADVHAIRATDRALERAEHRVLGAFVARFQRAVAAREEAG